MNKIVAIVLFLALNALFISCEEETILSVDQTSITIPDTGGSQSITLTANKTWSASPNQSWCKVSPSSGEEAASSRLSISCDANTTYEDRSCTVTITCAELTKTISVTQATNKGLIVSQSSYDLTSAAQQLNIEVKANVKFGVEIDNGCKDWVKYNSTKGLTTSTIILDIAENKSYDNREGKVTIKQEGGSISSTISIKQSQKAGLIISTSEYKVSSEKQTLTVDVQSNVSFEVKPGVDWVKYVETKALQDSKIILEIMENNSVDKREGLVTVSGNGITESFKIIQDAAKPYLSVSPTDIQMEDNGGSFNLTISSNLDYNIRIDEDWVKQVSTSENVITFEVSRNETYDTRKTDVIFINERFKIESKATITQSQKDTLILEQSVFNVPPEGGTISIKVSTNIAFEVTIPDNDWISYVKTKALNNKEIVLNAKKNEDRDERSITIEIKAVDSTISKEITLNQKSIYCGIYNEEDLCILAEELNKPKESQSTKVLSRYGKFNDETGIWRFFLVNNIRLSKDMMPIGTKDNPFLHTFDGNDKTIEQIRLTNYGNLVGMFGCIGETGVVQNICISENTVFLTLDNSHCGIIAGENYGLIDHCINRASIKTTLEPQTFGGIVGVNYGRVENCENYGEVVADGYFKSAGYIGGIAGWQESGSIISCVNYGKIKTKFSTNSGAFISAGGITGRASSGRIELCQNHGDVDISESDYNHGQSGGIIGWNSTCFVFACVNSGNISSSYTSHYLNYYTSSGGICGSSGLAIGCYNTGIISSIGGYAGGISGECGHDVIAFASFTTTIPTEKVEVFGKTDPICGYRYNIAYAYGCWVIQDGKDGIHGYVSVANAKSIIPELNASLDQFRDKFPDVPCNYEWYDDPKSPYPSIRSK